jgi:hypothetical protein
MTLENNRTEQRKYVSVLADGLFHMNVEEGTEGAKTREYETSAGLKGVKHELTFDTLSGMLGDVFFFDGEYGNTLHLIVDDIELSLNVSSNFAEDLMQKLPNIDKEKSVVFKPYSFVDDRKKTRRGITVTQDDQKVGKFFMGEDKKPTNGLETVAFPEAKEGKAISTDMWKLYFAQVRAFLVNYIEDNIATK